MHHPPWKVTVKMNKTTTTTTTIQPTNQPTTIKINTSAIANGSNFFSLKYFRRCTLLIGCLFCGSWKRKFLLQIHTRCFLVGCRYHDYCWIWWHDVWAILYLFIFFFSLLFIFRIVFLSKHFSVFRDFFFVSLFIPFLFIFNFRNIFAATIDS